MRFVCDFASRDHGPIGNRFSSLSFWHYLGTTPDERVWHEWAESIPAGDLKGRYPWLAEMQVFIASGGGYRGYPRGSDDVSLCEFDRDLFQDPSNSAILDDYDFAPLTRACANMLRQGVKPCLKLHAVPVKLSGNPKIDWFRVNSRPPRDYAVYANYLEALVRALVTRFGDLEVSEWRWFVGTEMENRAWWEADDGTPGESMNEFFRLYDWSVAAIDRVLPAARTRIGAHAMMDDGFWDARRFIEHCASGRNDATGGIGARLDFFAVSYYDHAPAVLESDEWNTPLAGQPGTLSRLPDKVARTRAALDTNGFSSVPIEVSEGAMLFGTDGKWLWHGLSPGSVYDASWTAWALYLMLEHGIVTWSRWSVLRTGGLLHGIESSATHALRLVSHLADDVRVAVRSEDAEEMTRVIAGIDAHGERCDLLLFRHAPDVRTPLPPAEARIQIEGLPLSGPVRVRTWVVDEQHGDFWHQWETDRLAAGLCDAHYFRSRDQLDVRHALIDPTHVAYWEAMEQRYRTLAEFPAPSETFDRVISGCLTLDVAIRCFAVHLIEIVPARASDE